MKPKKQTTYILRPKFYFSNSVMIVTNVTPDYVIGQILNLDTWKKNSTRIRQEKFVKEYEISPVQLR